MTADTEQFAAQQEPLTRMVDNATIYASLTGALEVHILCDQASSGYRLIRVNNRLDAVGGNEFEIALVDDTSSSVAYYGKVTLVHLQNIGIRHVARIQIWRSADTRHFQALRDISQRVLFGYLIQHYDILLDESGLTEGGKFYWHRQVSRAIDGGFHAYLYEPVTQALRLIPSQRALDGIEDQAWSGTSHESLQALISICKRDSL